MSSIDCYLKIHNTPFDRRGVECNADNKERSFRVVVEAFEEQWDGEGEFQLQFRKWHHHSKYNFRNNKHPWTLGLDKYISDEQKKEGQHNRKTLKEKDSAAADFKAPKPSTADLSYGVMFKDMVKSIKGIARSGVSLVDNEEHEHRYKTCLKCEFLTAQTRCTKCGCFMKLKSKFSAMKCPIRKW